MTIPEDVIMKAAQAVHNTSIYSGCGCETCQQEAISAVHSALPILRAAIRVELVEEMIAYAESEEVMMAIPDDNGNVAYISTDDFSPDEVRGILTAYLLHLSESETTP